MEDNKINKDLICVFCGTVIPDISVASSAKPVREGNCCVECYVQHVMGPKILKEIDDAEFHKKYGKNATTEKRVFGKKN